MVQNPFDDRPRRIGETARPPIASTQDQVVVRIAPDLHVLCHVVSTALVIPGERVIHVDDASSQVKGALDACGRKMTLCKTEASGGAHVEVHLAIRAPDHVLSVRCHVLLNLCGESVK